MTEIYRFQQGTLKGEIKKAESSDNPDELMIISMPLVDNVDMSIRGGIQIDCPLCGRKCWALPQMKDAVHLYPGRLIGACTQCSLRANLNKGSVPRRLKELGVSADDLLEKVLTHFQNQD